MAGWWIGLGAIAAVVAAAPHGARAVKRRLRQARDDHSRRPALWNRFYAAGWGETTTNNYGFAPAPGDHPQRFQHQMYRELLRRLEARRPLTPGLRMLEVSCGRGGGLDAFVSAAPVPIEAIGLDVADRAIAFCRTRYPGRAFVAASALDLPFPDASFDVLLNVEASNDYGDRARFFREVARVLKPDGVFLYADNFRPSYLPAMHEQLAAAGLSGAFDDVTANVIDACRLDTARRRAAIRAAFPLATLLLFGKDLENYAAMDGSRKLGDFVHGRRSYLMTAAVKS